VRGALANVPGVGKIDIEAGEPDFTVHYDSTKITPADIVAKLKAAGESGARVKA
jgi:copper chaperone CopZ